MSDAPDPPGLLPVPGSAGGRGRVVVDLRDLVDAPTRRRAGVVRERYAARRRACAIRAGSPRSSC